MTALKNLVCAFSNWMLDAPHDAVSQPEPDSSILLAIQAHSGVSIREIATMFGLTHSGAVRAIDRLQDSGEPAPDRC
jgi:DNA-binding MarR family transcriptional regulator